MLLYDFLCTNKICVGNFAYNHLVNYTYIKGSHRSYIDHVILPRYIFNNLCNCTISDQTVDGYEWSSGHLPIRTHCTLSINEPEQSNLTDNNAQDIPKFPFMKWDDRNVRDSYEENIRVVLHKVMNVTFNDITDKNIADNIINTKCEELNNVIHNAVEKAMFDRPSNYQGRHGKVPWWNTERTVARNRMRFWRNI